MIKYFIKHFIKKTGTPRKSGSDNKKIVKKQANK
jgi:hypothetical protein